MKITLLFLSLLCVAIFAAPANEAETILACPRAVIIIHGPTGLRARARVSENSGRLTGLPNAPVTYQSALGRSDTDRDYGSVSWRHVVRTEFGDIYLVVFTSPSGKKEAVSLVFDGGHDVSCKRGDWSLSITQEKPDQSPEPTPLRVTPAAVAPVAPAPGAAHL